MRVPGEGPAVCCLSEMVQMDFSVCLFCRSKAEREGILLCRREGFLRRGLSGEWSIQINICISTKIHQVAIMRYFSHSELHSPSLHLQFLIVCKSFCVYDKQSVITSSLNHHSSGQPYTLKCHIMQNVGSRL